MSDPKPGEPGYHIPGARGDASRFAAARREQVEADERLDDASRRGDLIAVYRELQGEAAKAALRMLKKWNRAGNKGGERLILEASREARQLTDRLIELIAAEGAAAQAESFFAELSSRVETLAPALAQGAKPLASPAA